MYSEIYNSTVLCTTLTVQQIIPNYYTASCLSPIVLNNQCYSFCCKFISMLVHRKVFESIFYTSVIQLSYLSVCHKYWTHRQRRPCGCLYWPACRHPISSTVLTRLDCQEMFFQVSSVLQHQHVSKDGSVPANFEKKDMHCSNLQKQNGKLVICSPPLHSQYGNLKVNFCSPPQSV